jgi:hypothetical protein
MSIVREDPSEEKDIVIRSLNPPYWYERLDRERLFLIGSE